MPTLLLREPADIRYVLRDAAPNFTKTPLLSGEAGKQLFGEGSSDEFRRTPPSLRTALQPLFSRASAMKFGPAVVETIKQITAAWPNPGVHDLRVIMPEINEAVNNKILFGTDYLEAKR